ncbi:tail fiber domain-containing protein [Candidatus Falkowbacteria bacterium]|nr:tail fiber domain-containing protein [Candidatus Falkowbacteria bacterium]
MPKKLNPAPFFYFFLTVFLALGLSISLQSLLAAWTNPTQTPPGGNLDEPVNVSTTDQAKLGGLGIGGNFTVNGASSFTGNVGIGTASPGAKLDVAQATNGQNGAIVRMPLGAEATASGIKVYGYSPAVELLDKDSIMNWHIGIDDNDDNKFLIGRGYGPGQGVVQAITIDTSDNVGIGTTGPSYKLDVQGGDINASGVYRKGGTSGTSLSCSSGQVIKTATVSGGIVTAGSCTADDTGGSVGGSGNGNYLAKWTTGTSLESSLIYDNGTNIGINTATPVRALDVVSKSTDINYSTATFSNDRSGGYGVAIGSRYNELWGRIQAVSGLPAGPTINANLALNPNGGNIGIGTDSPAIKLAIGDTDTGLQWISDGNLAIYTNSVERMRIDSSGNVGIGISPSTKLHVNGSIKSEAGINATTALYAPVFTDTDNTSYSVDPNGTSKTNYFYRYAGFNGVEYDANNGAYYIDPNNNSVFNNIYATAYYYNSDVHLKNSISPISSPLDKILKLNGREFIWKDSGKKDVGLIAQEVEKVFPELVSTDEKTGLKSVQYGNLVAPLIEAVKEQQAEIEELRVEIGELKAEQ